MRNTFYLQLASLFFAIFLAACTHPIAEESRARIDPATTLAMVSENPDAFLDQHLLIGGVVRTIESLDEGSILEIMEWQLSRWGEPLYLDDAGRLFLAKTTEALDPKIYEPGTLVTLSGIVMGSESKLSAEREYNYPVVDITEIHLWETPFRYGIHSNPDPAYPYFVDQSDDPHRHPYDPDYNPYPYTQHWYRGSLISW